MGAADGRPERFAAAAIVGVAKGVLTGLLIGAVPAFVMLSQSPPAPLAEVGRILAGLVLAGAAICGLDATSGRIASEPLQRVLRFLAGLLGPVAFVSPQYALTAADQVPLIPPEALPIVAGGGAALGVGFVFAGEPDTPPHRAQGCARLAIAVTTACGGVAVVAAFNAGVSDGIGFCLGGLFTGYAGVAVFWLVQQLVSLALPPLALWLEPDFDIDAPDHPRADVLRELDTFERCLRAASDAEPVRREMQLHDALAAMDRLEPLVHSHASSVTPGTLAQRRAEVYLLLGKLDDAAKLAGTARDGPAIEIEVARRRGDLEGAAKLASRWLDAAATDRTFRAKSVQASAFALLALVRADQGRFDEAQGALDTLKKIPAWHSRAFRHLNAPEVAFYIVACRSKKSGPRPSSTT